MIFSFCILQHEKLSILLAKYIGKPIPNINASMSVAGSTFEASSQPKFQNQANLNVDSAPLDNVSLPFQFKGITDVEKTYMIETAAKGMDELIRLLRIDEPLWNKSLTDGKYVMNREGYDKICVRASHFKSSSARFESSKDSRLVNMNGIQLVDIFFDSVSPHNSLFIIILQQRNGLTILTYCFTGQMGGYVSNNCDRSKDDTNS